MPILLAVLALVVVASCAADSGSQGTVPDERETDLTIAYDAGDGATPVTWTLTCDPAGGTHPDATAACAALEAAAEEALAPVPDDAICTQIWGGPQTATLTGVWRGEPVEASFNRLNGCEIARWDSLVPLLPQPE